MKRTTLLASATAAASWAAFVAPAHASYIGVVPGGSAQNDFVTTFSTGAPIEGWYNAELLLEDLVDASASVTVEIFGSEAGYLNSYSFGTGDGAYAYAGASGMTFMNTGPASLGMEDAIHTGSYDGLVAGLLPFLFKVETPSGNTLEVANGASMNVGMLPNFFVAFDDQYTFDTTVDGKTAESGNSVFLFLDDGGAGPDNDHDDLVVRLTATGGRFQVPEPVSLGLLGVGLIGIGFARRRRQS